MTILVVLASASPARLATLRRAGLDPVTEVSGVDESAVTDPVTARLALRLAELKGRTVLETRRLATSAGGELVIACDSVLEVDGVAYGKPSSADEARERLLALSGRSGVLHTGHFVAHTGTGEAVLRGATTVVRFAALTTAEIDAYVATGEPLHVAGAFTIDGLGGAFIEGIEGDPHNVVGISLPLLRLLVNELGVEWTSLWRP